MSTREQLMENIPQSPFPVKIVAGIGYECPNWEQTGNMYTELSTKIRDSSCKTDRFIILVRGGLPLAKPLMDHTEVKKISTIRPISYTGINQREGVSIEKPGLQDSIEGENVVVADDLSDYGFTFEEVLKYLEDFKPREIKTAALFVKPWSTYIPDFVLYKTESWVVFPNEPQESIKKLINLWSGEKLSVKETISRFKEIGIPQIEIDYFVSGGGFGIK